MCPDISPLPVGLALNATRWDQTPLVVRPWVVQLLAVILHQAVRIAALDARWQQRSRHADRPPSSGLPYEKLTTR
jgi:hypothetical protein